MTRKKGWTEKIISRKKAKKAKKRLIETILKKKGISMRLVKCLDCFIIIMK